MAHDAEMTITSSLPPKKPKESRRADSTAIKLKTNDPQEKSLLLKLRKSLDASDDALWEAGKIINILRDKYGYTALELKTKFQLRQEPNRLNEIAKVCRMFPEGIRNPQQLSFSAYQNSRKSAVNVAHGLTAETGKKVTPKFQEALAVRQTMNGKKAVRENTKALMAIERKKAEPSRRARLRGLSEANKELVGKMIHGDAAETIAALKDQSIRVIHLDPPYANYRKTPNGKLLGCCATVANHADNDTRVKAMAVTIAAINAAVPKMVLNGVLLVWQSGYPLTWQMAKAIEDAGLEMFPPIIWNKGAPQMGDPSVVARCSVEICYIMCRNGEAPRNFLPDDSIGQIVTGPRPNQRASNFHPIHQMQKPDWLNEEILRRFTEPGDTVVDAFGCSASMGTACEKMGRNWIYSESNEHNYKLGKENMERYFLGQQVKKVG